MKAPASPTPLTQRRRESSSPESALKPRSWHTYYIQPLSPTWTDFNTPGRQLGRRSISVSDLLITQNHVHYIGITFIYQQILSSFFIIHLETSHMPFHIIIWLTLNIENTSVLYDIHGPTLWTTKFRSSTYSGGNPRGSAPIRGPPLGADIWCHTSPHALSWQHVCYNILEVT